MSKGSDTEFTLCGVGEMATLTAEHSGLVERPSNTAGNMRH